jgi:hypothetical protein
LILDTFFLSQSRLNPIDQICHDIDFLSTVTEVFTGP